MIRIVRCAGLLPMSVSLVAFLSIAASSGNSAETTADSPESSLARAILDATSVKGGLVVHVGCGDGRLTAALGADNRCVVQGLEANPQNVEAARKHIRSLGCYGRVSVQHWDGEQLPYADNLVNLLVVEGDSFSMEEVSRVICPGGAAYIHRDGKWKKTIKPWPMDIDVWTHFLHDASNNAVSSDRRVAPPKHLQWDGGPRWSRSHETDMSVTAVVSAGGKIFHTLDEGPIGIHETPLPARRFPDQCSLVARDAFNGIVLWKRRMPEWGSAAWDDSRWRWGKGDQLWSAPLTLPRRLVAAGDKVYVTLGFRAGVSELDASTGKTIREFEGTDRTEEIVFREGILVLRINAKQHSAVMAIDVEADDVLWKKNTGAMADLTLAASGSKVCFVSDGELIAVDLRTGRELWKSAPRREAKRQTAETLVMHDGVVLRAAAGTVQAFAASDGKLLWRKKTGTSFRGMPDIFVAGGMVWIGTLTTRGFDPKTGEEKKQIQPGHLFTGGHHSRCHRGKATDEFLLWSKRGVEFVDLVGDRHMKHDWVRGTCRYGILPANGLLYAPPHPCFCYPGVKLTGFNALSAQDSSVSDDRHVEPRLVQGPSEKVSQPAAASPSDWPTYRCDNVRSGRAGTQVPTQLKEVWQTSLRGKITPPVVAGGRVFLAGVDTHSLHCLDANDGKQSWSYTAGGPVDSPPTISQGRVLFGCTDGSVYCLRASDGKLAWQFHAAPYAKRIVSYGRVESAWPIHGSVLVEDGTVYFAAGRSSFLDGGIYLYALDVVTGEIRHRGRLEGPKPNLGKPSSRAHEMDGGKNDILVSNGEKLFLLQNVFDFRWKQLETPTIAKHGARKTDLHLAATGGFLDDSMFDRNFWMYADRWPGLYVAVAAPKAGQILAFDDNTTYGLHVFNRKFSRSPYFDPGSGYELFADDNDNEPVLDPKNAGRERGTMTRAKPPRWTVKVPVRAQAMVLADPAVFLAGPPDPVDAQDPLGALEGRKGALLWVASTTDGRKIAEYRIESPPVFDGMAAAGNKLFLSLLNGKVVCYGAGGRE